MLKVVFIIITIFIFIVFVSILVHQSIKFTRNIHIKSIKHSSIYNNNQQQQQSESNILSPQLQIYFKDSSTQYITSGLINNIYLDFDNTRIPIQSTKHKHTIPIEFSESWLFKQSNINILPNTTIDNVIFDFVYIDITIDMNTRYRIYMHDNNTFRMGEIIKFDFNKTLHWFDQSNKSWSQQRTHHIYTAPILQSTIKLTPKSTSIINNKLIIDCPITNNILPLIP